jgi:hypothetical protein
VGFWYGFTKAYAKVFQFAFNSEPTRGNGIIVVGLYNGFIGRRDLMERANRMDRKSTFLNYGERSKLKEDYTIQAVPV